MWSGIRRQLTGWIDGATLWRAFFSLALATMLWLWVTNLEDPETTRRFPNITPIITRRPPDLIVLDQDRLPPVTVDIRGPRSAVQDVDASDIRAELDLGGLTSPGAKEVRVTIRAPRRVRVVGISREQVTVTVDQLASRSFPLEIEPQPSPASYNISRVEPATRQVTVSGPASALDRVVRVVLPVTLGDRRDSFEAQFAPEPRDAGGARVQGVTVEPATVSAAVTVTRVGRTVSVVADLVGTPPEGYRVVGSTVSPSFVVVDGPPEQLNQLILIPTAPIRLDDQTKSFSVFDVPLLPPPGIRLVDPVTINVQVQIERQEVRQQFSGLRIAAINVGPGLRATITPDEIAITLTGPPDRVRRLSAGDIQVTVDAQGLGPGSYTLTPRVSVPAELQVVELPLSVRVQLERAATPVAPSPTPTHGPAPSPTPPATPASSGGALPAVAGQASARRTGARPVGGGEGPRRDGRA